MGARPDGSPGVLVCCSSGPRASVAVLFVCACLLTAMVVATSTTTSAAAAAMATTGSPPWHSGEGSSRTAAHASDDAFWSSKRRIPKGPDPIHNRRAGKTTIAPRRRD